MGLLDRAKVNAKEDESGEGLLSRAGRYATPAAGSADAAVSPEGEAKTPRAGDGEEEMEHGSAAPPSRPESVGKRERKGLLRRALAVSEEQPKTRRQSRREKRRAEKEASPGTPFEETPPVGGGDWEGLSFDETVIAGSGEPSGLLETGHEAAGFETVGSTDAGLFDLGQSDAEQSEQGIQAAAVSEMGQSDQEVPVPGLPAAEEFPAGTPAVPPGEGREEPSVDLTSEFPADLDFGDEEISTPEKAVESPALKRKKGLLAVASRFAVKEGAGKGKPRRARPGARQAVAAKTGGARRAIGAPIEQAPMAKKEAAEARRPSRAVKGRIAKAAGHPAPPEKRTPRGEVFTPREEAVLPETGGIAAGGAVPEMKDFARSLETFLSRRDALSALDLFNETITREGHTSFVLRILEAMTSLGKGKSGLLFTPSGDRYAVELRVPSLEKQTRQKSASFRQDSRFIQALKESGRGFVKPGGGKGEALKKEISPLGSFFPWMAVPLPVGNELVAFVVIGKRPNRPKTDEGAVALLARLSAPYINKYLLLKERRFALSSLEKELKERDSLYSLHSAFESPREKLELPERCVRVLVEGISANLGFASAAVLADWKPKTSSGVTAQGTGSYVPVASVGVPEKALSRCKVSVKDREIWAIMEAGRPSVPKDASKRIAALARYASTETGGRSGERGAAPKWPRSYAAAPLLFNGDSLGLLVVYDMKGAGKTIGQEAEKKLGHAARVLVPALLYGKLHSAGPFDTMRALISNQLEEARRNDVPLAVSVFIVENAKKACGELGFGKYWGVVERLRKLIETMAGEKGVVKDVDWNRLVLFFREHGEDEVDDVIARVRTGFSSGLRKNERESGISLATLITRYPRESKTVQDILVSVM